MRFKYTLFKLKFTKHIVCMGQKMLCILRCLESKHLQNEQKLKGDSFPFHLI